MVNIPFKVLMLVVSKDCLCQVPAHLILKVIYIPFHHTIDQLQLLGRRSTLSVQAPLSPTSLTSCVTHSGNINIIFFLNITKPNIMFYFKGPINIYFHSSTQQCIGNSFLFKKRARNCIYRKKVV